MRILHTVGSYYPEKNGMAEVARQLSERLVKLGHEVTVATSTCGERTSTCINGVNVRDFPISGNAVSGYQGNTSEYVDFLLQSRFDVVTNFAAQSWATDLMLPILEHITYPKVIVPTGFSNLFVPEYQGYFSLMPNWLGQYDRCVFLSENYRDINFARQCQIEGITVIPNGAAEDEFLTDIDTSYIRAKLGIEQNSLLILHVGALTGIKGHNESIRIFGESGLRSATLVLVSEDFLDSPLRRTIRDGKKVLARRKNLRTYLASFRNLLALQAISLLYSLRNRLSRRSIIRIALMRTDTVALFREADIFLFPSRIECSPIVLFECLAAKTPFLSTDVGNSAEIIHWSGGGILLPTDHDLLGFGRARIKESASLLTKIADDVSARQIMAQSGFAAWYKRFRWEHIVKQYEMMYSELVHTKANLPLTQNDSSHLS